MSAERPTRHRYVRGMRIVPRYLPRPGEVEEAPQPRRYGQLVRLTIAVMELRGLPVA